MKKESNSRITNKERFNIYNDTDTRYYGVFIYGKSKSVKVDSKRFFDVFNDVLPKQIENIKSRNTHYYYPSEKNRYDYSVNIIVDELLNIRNLWDKYIKDSINRALSNISYKEISLGDNDNYLRGIDDFDEAATEITCYNAMQNCYYKNLRSMVKCSMYSQFFHLMVSCIEAVSIKMLIKNGWKNEKNNGRFSINELYNFLGKKACVERLPNYRWHNITYKIWNFIKHNSKKAYDDLYKLYPDILIKKKFTEGDLAIYYIIFSDDLIVECLDGVINFFKEYCETVFNENFEKAQWDYGEYFIQEANRVIKEETDF